MGVLRDLWKDGVASSVDLLGEATVTQDEAQRYAERCAVASADAEVASAEAREAQARRTALLLGGGCSGWWTGGSTGW